jgi:hypothetical protein
LLLDTLDLSESKFDGWFQFEELALETILGGKLMEVMEVQCRIPPHMDHASSKPALV